MPSRDGHQFEPCIAHHSVRLRAYGFPGLKMPRYARGLAALHAVCDEDSEGFVAPRGRKRPSVSGRKIPFPKRGQPRVGMRRMLIPGAHDAAPFWRVAFGLDDFRKDKIGRRLIEGRRLETERGPLLGPN